MSTLTESLPAPGRRALSAQIPGLALTGALAFLAIESAGLRWVHENGGSALTLAIVLGMIVGNTLYTRLGAASAAGVGFSKQQLLRLGIVLFGIRLTFQDIGQVGIAGVIVDAVVLGTTFALAVFLGTRLFGLDGRTAVLIGAGSSICGAAAVLAAEPIVRGRAEQATVAVSTVVVFGTIGIFLYPALYRWNAHLGLVQMSPSAYGVYAGSTMHEVAQVVAAGRAVGERAADTAVITKMVRVMMLAPFLIALSAILSRRHRGDAGSTHAEETRRITVPWFALGFLMVAGLNSLVRLPASVVSAVSDLDTAILAMAMAALGLTTNVSALRSAGLKPLLLAATLFAWLVGGGFVINAVVRAAFT